MLLPMLASADAVEINGIYYNLVSKVKQAEVTKGNWKIFDGNSTSEERYHGDIVIPETIEYEGSTYTVKL